MNVHRVLALLATPGFLSACAGQGPPRPDDTAPFPMPNAPGVGLPNEQSYRPDETADLVLDEVTGLEWQRGVDAGPGDAGGFVWHEALSHCEALVQGGLDDFRLPTRLELVTIVDASRSNPSIDPFAFPMAPAEATWSGSALATDPERAYGVDFLSGATSSSSLASPQRARCVRNARRPRLPTTDRFETSEGAVVDRMTGLTWEREVLLVPKTFADAAKYCEELAVDGSGGFRAPTMKELQTLVDEARTPVAIDPDAFPDADPGSHWSSSLVARDGASGWFVRFSDGTSDRATVDTLALVRCVR